MTNKRLDGLTGRLSAEEVCRRPIRILFEISQFLRRHLIHLLIFVPAAFVLMTVHESAHAVVALARGGVIQELHLLPTRQNWGGSISFKFPAGAEQTSWEVSLAPYMVCLSLAALTTGIAVRRPPKSYFVASCWFVWGFIMPLQDLLNAALFWSQGAHNDFYEAFGPTSLVGSFATGTLIILFMAWGARVQRELYSDQKLSSRAWWALSGSTLTGFIALTFIALRCTQNR
jgi:hypothetical protein